MMDESSKMDFAHADAAPAERLNEIIWKSVRGYDSAMPPTPHGPPPTVHDPETKTMTIESVALGTRQRRRALSGARCGRSDVG